MKILYNYLSSTLLTYVQRLPIFQFYNFTILFNIHVLIHIIVKLKFLFIQFYNFIFPSKTLSILQFYNFIFPSKTLYNFTNLQISFFFTFEFSSIFCSFHLIHQKIILKIKFKAPSPFCLKMII